MEDRIGFVGLVKIITNVKGDGHRTVATVALRQYADDEVTSVEGGEKKFESGKVNIWREKASDINSHLTRPLGLGALGVSERLRGSQPQTQSCAQARMNCAETVVETAWAIEAQALSRNAVAVFQSLLSDEEAAAILALTLDWVRSHADEIPGFKRLGAYYRFHRAPFAQWLGGLDVLLQAEEVSLLLKVPKSWVYANADQIPGAIRLGRYLRFRPAVIKSFLGGSEVAQ